VSLALSIVQLPSHKKPVLTVVKNRLRIRRSPQQSGEGFSDRAKGSVPRVPNTSDRTAPIVISRSYHSLVLGSVNVRYEDTKRILYLPINDGSAVNPSSTWIGPFRVAV
jgi:hypothetical protein